jgi:hypothetical protein
MSRCPTIGSSLRSGSGVVSASPARSRVPQSRPEFARIAWSVLARRRAFEASKLQAACSFASVELLYLPAETAGRFGSLTAQKMLRIDQESEMEADIYLGLDASLDETSLCIVDQA